MSDCTVGCTSIVKRPYSSMSLTLEEDSQAWCKQWVRRLSGSQNLVFLHKSSFSIIKGWILEETVFHRRAYLIKGYPHLLVIIHQRSSSIKVNLPSNMVFPQRSSSIEGLSSKIVFPRTIFHQMSSSMKVQRNKLGLSWAKLSSSWD